MAHALAKPQNDEIAIQVKLPTALAEHLDEIARILGRPRTRIAADVVMSFVFEFGKAQALQQIAATDAAQVHPTFGG